MMNGICAAAQRGTASPAGGPGVSIDDNHRRPAPSMQRRAIDIRPPGRYLRFKLQMSTF